MIVKLMKIILKNQKRETILECLLLLTIFLLSFSTFIFYIDSYRAEWEDLFYTETPSDLQFSISETLTTFSFISPQLQRLFSSSSFILNPPSLLFSAFANESFSLPAAIYLACSSNLFNQLSNTSLPTNEIHVVTSNLELNTSSFSIVYLATDNPQNLSITSILSPTELENSMAISSSLFYNYIESSSTYSDDLQHDIPIVLFSVSHLFSLFRDGNSTLLEELSSSGLYHSDYHFVWGHKLHFLDSFPKSVIAEYNKWAGVYFSNIREHYYPDYIFSSSLSIQSFKHFEENLQHLNDKFLSSFLSSLFFFVVISSFFMTIFYFYLKNQVSNLQSLTKFLTTKGTKTRTISNSLLLLHLLNFITALVLSCIFIFTLSFLLNYYTWSFYYVIFGFSIGVNFIIAFFFEYRVLTFLNSQIVESQTDKGLSQSSIIRNVILFSTTIFALVILTVVIYIAFFDGKDSISLTILIFPMLLLISLYLSLRYIPEIIRNYFYPSLSKLLVVHRRANKFFIKVLNYSYRDQKNLWSILFTISLITSIFIFTYSELNNYENTKYQTMFLNEYTIILNDGRDLTRITNNFNISEYCGLYYSINTVYSLNLGTNFIVLLDSPLSYYESVTAHSSYFARSSNKNLFSLLNTSHYATITNKVTADKLYLTTNNDFTLEYDHRENTTGIVEERTLVKTVEYLPFVTNFLRNHNYFLSAYSKDSAFSNLINEGLMRAVLSVNLSKNLTTQSLADFLYEQNIEYTVYNKENYGYIFNIDPPVNTVISSSKISFSFLIIFFPVIAFSFTAYIYSKIKTYFYYFEIRGLKSSLTTKSIYLFLGSLISTHLAFTVMLTLILILMLSKIAETVLIMPYSPSLWVYLIIASIFIGLALLFYVLLMLLEKSYPMTKVLNNE